MLFLFYTPLRTVFDTHNLNVYTAGASYAVFVLDEGFKMKSQKKETRNQGAALKPIRRSPMKGVVISRTCRSCGHHEIGMMSEDGGFVALKPGMKIAVLQGEN
jgi:hypothetical protein